MNNVIDLPGRAAGGGGAAPRFSAAITGALGQSAADVAARNREIASSAPGLDARNEGLVLTLMRSTAGGMTAKAAVEYLALNTETLDRNAQLGGRRLDAAVPRTGLTAIGLDAAQTETEEGAKHWAELRPGKQAEPAKKDEAPAGGSSALAGIIGLARGL